MGYIYVMKTYIYTLSCPISGDVRYVGKANKPKERYTKHCSEKLNTDKSKWIQSLTSQGLRPILTIISEIPLDNWQKEEKVYISRYRDLGCILLNTSTGGEGSNSGNKTSFKKGQNAKKVVALNMDGSYHKTFNSIKDGIEYLNGNKHISDVLSGKTKKCGGYIWLYENEYIEMNEEDLNKKVENANTININYKNSGFFKKGQIPWNKSIKMSEEYKENWRSKNTSIFIKGQIPWNKGLKNK